MDAGGERRGQRHVAPAAAAAAATAGRRGDRGPRPGAADRAPVDVLPSTAARVDVGGRGRRAPSVTSAAATGVVVAMTVDVDGDGQLVEVVDVVLVPSATVCTPTSYSIPAACYRATHSEDQGRNHGEEIWKKNPSPLLLHGHP